MTKTEGNKLEGVKAKAEAAKANAKKAAAKPSLKTAESDAKELAKGRALRRK